MSSDEIDYANAEEEIARLLALSDALEKEYQELRSKRPKVKRFTECFDAMQKLGPTGWDSPQAIQEALDEVRGAVCMTDKEREVMQMLVVFWNAFCELHLSGNSDQQRVADAVHAIQGVLAMRVARRANPELWR